MWGEQSPEGSLGTTSAPILGEDFELCLVEILRKGDLLICLFGRGEVTWLFCFIFLLLKKKKTSEKSFSIHKLYTGVV